VEGSDKQPAVQHVLPCHSVTTLSSIAVLGTSGRIFKSRCVLKPVGKCRTAKVKIELISSFFLNWTNLRSRFWNYWLTLSYVWSVKQTIINVLKHNRISSPKTQVWVVGSSLHSDIAVGNQRPDGKSKLFCEHHACKKMKFINMFAVIVFPRYSPS
jgi:hypothetical protein